MEHFHNDVCRKIGGQGRAMVVTNGIQRAMEYYFAIKNLLAERKSQYKAIVAFSGDAEYNGIIYNEAKLNGFPSSQIEKKFKHDPYRILIVANKFQTGYDEPLLHTMYVDKGLDDIKAVQTLSRLNRCCAKKTDTFVLDFVNDTESIKRAFSRYYKTTILSGETDANKLNDLIDAMEPMEVYLKEDIDKFVDLYLNNAQRDKLDPILDRCVERYENIDVEDQIEFKSSAKTFVRTYNFLSAILPYGSTDWEKLSIFLNLLVSKLPRPKDEDNIEEIIEDVDLENYRLVAKETMSLQLEDENAEIDAIPVKTDIAIPVPEFDTLSNIISFLNEEWGGYWSDENKTSQQIIEVRDIVLQDESYKNAMGGLTDVQNAKDECERATADAIIKTMASGMELYSAFYDDLRNKNNQSFKKWLLDFMFASTYMSENGAAEEKELPIIE
ncbi:MAG: type I restriction endonuclease subunit R [Lachnospiraceae bacterium]|nr:type I restriction endonuclease subunit R [Lachnospiraceae bacterium]